MYNFLVNIIPYNYNLENKWNSVSKEAIALIKKLMAYNPKERITAAEALHDPWIVTNSENKIMATQDLKDCVENLKSFKAINSMQKAVLTYMASRVITKEEEKKLRDIFTLLDKNGDGQLSQEEMIEGYKLLCGGSEELAKKEVKKTMKNIDINKNGTIDYNGKIKRMNTLEFLIANINRTDCINKEKLRIAFDFFDEVNEFYLFIY